MTANRTVATSPPLGADRQHQGRRRRQDDRPQLSAAPGAANGPAVAVERVGEVSEAHAASFHAVRPRLFGIAYRVLRSAAGADDVVQDTWLRWQRTDRSKVSDAAAFLVTATTRLAINVAQSARARRETNIGLWLPEAVDTGADPADEAEQREALQLSVLMLLERLSPTERAAYVLREAFGYPYRQIAHVLTLSEANTRQLVTRARATSPASVATRSHPPTKRNSLRRSSELRRLEMWQGSNSCSPRMSLSARAVAGSSMRLTPRRPAVHPGRGSVSMSRHSLGAAQHRSSASGSCSVHAALAPARRYSQRVSARGAELFSSSHAYAIALRLRRGRNALAPRALNVRDDPPRQVLKQETPTCGSTRERLADRDGEDVRRVILAAVESSASIQVRLARALDGSTAAAEDILRQAQDAGIELAAITAQLEREGVQSFCASYHELIDRIKTKTKSTVPEAERPDAVG
jgi:RNA polymerase sigma factor (sigma-70 family)